MTTNHDNRPQRKIGGLVEFSQTLGVIQEIEPPPDREAFDDDYDYDKAHRAWWERTHLWRGV